MLLAMATILGTILVALFIQQPAPKPLAFDVAMIKPTAPEVRGGAIKPMPSGQGYMAQGIPLKLMIRLMYTITDSQVVGGPDWINTDRWDVQAKADGSYNVDQLHQMFQALMADRFELKFHREKRDLPAYELVLDKPGDRGSKMTANDSDNHFDIPILPAGRNKVQGSRVPMAYLAWWLSQQLNRPVLDKTGLDKFYDFTLEWAPDPQPPDGTRPPGAEAPAPPPDGPTMFTALREQLGLRLESRRSSVEVFVIDHAARPAEN